MPGEHFFRDQRKSEAKPARKIMGGGLEFGSDVADRAKGVAADLIFIGINVLVIGADKYMVIFVLRQSIIVYWLVGKFEKLYQGCGKAQFLV